MTAQEYIQQQLEEVKKPLGQPKPDSAQLEDEIVRLILSKKFRKYAIKPEHSEHIRSVVKICISENKPIQMTLVFGGYKLWRLEETPEVDWAELFALMYYTKWMKPICEIYEHGVWFDFFSDDVIVPIMNNVPPEGTKAYQSSFAKLLAFIKPYQPKNLNMTLNRVGDQYDSLEDFKKDLDSQVQKLKSSLDGGLPELNDVARATLELNVKTTQEQRDDPQWQEKVQLVHDGYAQVTGRRPYYRMPDKLNIMTTPFGGMLSVGTTKDSIMKFWIGAGVLKKRDDSFRQIICSPNQLSSGNYTLEHVKISGLNGKNFHKIRITE